MASFRVNLPPRSLVGLYSRLVRRELGLPASRFHSLINTGRRDGLFARSLAVAVGQTFAVGGSVRGEFAAALRDRLERYQMDAPPFDSPLADVLNHSISLCEIVARQELQVTDDTIAVGTLRISDPVVASATQGELQSLELYPRERFAADAFQFPLWVAAPAPRWWREYPEPADHWVAPMGRLGEPIWSSTEQLSGEDITFLLNFGLDRIDSNPQLIQPWTESVSNLVAAASRPHANIRKLVDCCRVDP